MSFGNILLWIVIGGLAGLLADWVVKGIRVGLLGAIIVGILGGFLGGWLFGQLNIAIGSGFWGSLISAFVGAVILLFVLRALRRVFRTRRRRR